MVVVVVVSVMDNYAVCGCCCHLMRFAVVCVGTFLNSCGVVKTIGGRGGEGVVTCTQNRLRLYTTPT